MLLLVDLLGFIISTGLFYDELHSQHSLSHFSVHLYFDSVQVIVQILSKANHLTQRTFYSFLQHQIANLETNTSV